MKKIWNGKMAILAALILWVGVVRCLTGCVQNEAPEKLRDLDFTVVGDGEVPEELKKLIESKKAAFILWRDMGSRRPGAIAFRCISSTSRRSPSSLTRS